MNIEIVAIGASTSVGSNANVSAASVRAGLGRNQLYDLESGASCHVAVLPSDDADATPSSLSRSRDLLGRALREVAERLGADASLRMYLAAPSSMQTEDLLPPGTRVGGLRFVYIERVEDESGLAGLKMALAALRAGECDMACLAGVDVRTDDATLAELEQRGLLLTDESPWGFIPGEGAGAVLLATEQTRIALKLVRLAEIRACATDIEAAATRGAPCTGEALSRALRYTSIQRARGRDLRRS
jgi:3-oxoacyl-[acyl-carrier-protein] synthase I